MKVRTVPMTFLSIALGAALVGCDEKVAEKTSVQTKSDGTQVEKKETVTREADGDVVHEKKTDVDKPGRRQGRRHQGEGQGRQRTDPPRAGANGRAVRAPPSPGSPAPTARSWPA